MLLSSVKDEKTRTNYLKKAIQHKWGFPELKNALIQDKIEIDTSLPDQISYESSEEKTDVNIPRLSYKRGIINAYRVVEPKVFPDEKDTITIDCGFFIYHRILLNGKKPPGPGEIVTSVKTARGYTFKPWKSQTPSVSSALYTYRALLDRVIDADTIVLYVDCGFGLWTKQKLRLRRINAPEAATPKGKEAKEFVLERLKSAACIVIKTYSTDIYDRYLVDVFYLVGETEPAKTAAEGIYLNQELLDHGFAKVWQVFDPKELAFLD